MGQRINNPWIQRMIEKHNREGGYARTKNAVRTANTKEKPLEPRPALTGMDGIFFGTLGPDLNSGQRDLSTANEMRKYGYDTVNGGIDQLRFRRPMLHKALKDCAIACSTSQEPVLTFFTERYPTTQATIIKMAPVGDQIGWVAIDVGSLSSTVYDLFTQEVHDALGQFDLATQNNA